MSGPMSAHECVSRIEDLLEAGGDVTKEQVAELVWPYAAFCRQLNEKATRCLELLREGKRGDALRLAKEPPDLQQQLQLLNFSQRGMWLDICQGAGMPISHQLDPNAVGAIAQEVYAESGALDRLLRNFRRMSLGRAPLADRLRLLRRIRKADPQQDAWTDDIRAFEKARLTELAEEAEEANRQGDLDGLERILAELKGEDWLAKPARQIAVVERAAVPHRKRYAEARYRELAEMLHEAHGAMDEERCQALTEQCEAVARRTGVGPNGEVADEIAPVRAWLAELDAARQEDLEFEAACTALGAAIDEDDSRDVLERQAAAVLRFERGMAEVLAARYGTRIEEFDRTARRRFALLLSGIVGGILLIAAGVTFGIWSYHQWSERERWRTQIAGALEKDDLESAGKFLRRLGEEKPEFSETPEIQALEATFLRKNAREEARRAEFETIQQRIEGSGTSERNEDALERAAALARAPDEKQWVELWRQKYLQAEEEERREREEAFREKLDELKALHAKFSLAEADGRDDLGALGGPCLELARALLAEEALPKTLAAEAKAIEGHVAQAMEALHEAEETQRVIGRVLDELPKLVHRPEQLAGALERFVAEFPEHPLAAEFTRATAMAPYWKAAEEWRTLRAAWGDHIRIGDPDAAADRRRQLESYLASHGAGPHASAARTYQDYLETANAAFLDGRLLGIAKVSGTLRHVVFSPNLMMIRAKDGRTYYVLAKHLQDRLVQGGRSIWIFKYLISTEPRFGSSTLVDDRIAEGPFRAPQTLFAEHALGRLAAFDGTGWETLYLELSARAMDQEGMDPVLAGQVLEMLLGFAASCTPGRGQELREHADRLAEENLDFVPWLDPDDDSAFRGRLRVEQALRGMGPVKSVIADVERGLQAVADALDAYQPVGILLDRSEGVQLTPAAPRDGKLYVLFGGPAAAPVYRLFGTVAGGKVSRASASPPSCPEGTVVFMRTP